MDYALYSILDIFGITVLTILLFSYVSKKRSNQSMDQVLFRLMIIFNIAILLLDLLMYAINAHMFWFSIPLHYIFSNLYYISQIAVCFIWLLFTDYKLNQDIIGLKKRGHIYIIPFIIAFFFLIVNMFNPFIFSISSVNIYSRETLMLLFAIFPIYYFIHSFVLVIKHVKDEDSTKNKDKKYLIIFPILPVIAMIIQFMFFGISLIWISTIISLLILYVFYQNQQIQTDLLTGLNNRFSFETYIQHKIKYISPDSALFLLMLDIDEFKKINDTYGHVIGDEALCNTADLLSKTANKSDFIGRVGGDEFVIIGLRKNEKEVEELIKALKNNIALFNKDRKKDKYKIEISMGYNIIDKNDPESLRKLVSDADEKMYLEKDKKKQI